MEVMADNPLFCNFCEDVVKVLRSHNYGLSSEQVTYSGMFTEGHPTCMRTLFHVAGQGTNWPYVAIDYERHAAAIDDMAVITFRIHRGGAARRSNFALTQPRLGVRFIEELLSTVHEGRETA